jgi:hypothetical protein
MGSNYRDCPSGETLAIACQQGRGDVERDEAGDERVTCD